MNEHEKAARYADMHERRLQLRYLPRLEDE